MLPIRHPGTKGSGMQRILRFSAIVFLFVCGALAPAQAQNDSPMILVLDGSNSMWGQIDGVAKITIAQKVVSGLLDGIPESQILGLTVYGHRRKKGCDDIETVVPPATGTRTAIAKAVKAIKPKGRTPLSAAVNAAAKELDYTHQKATVILVSDGRETCDLDPCEIGRKLEKNGFDFTTHVIGFDVARKADRAQLQCLAENTGGEFRTASNAAELAEALAIVSAAGNDPAQIKSQISFTTRLTAGGDIIRAGLGWRLKDGSTAEIIQDWISTDQFSPDLAPGQYLIELRRDVDGYRSSLSFEVSASTPIEHVLVLPPLLPSATLDAPATARVGELVTVNWTGPANDGDYLTVVEPAKPSSEWLGYAGIRGTQPLLIQMPQSSGRYELRYVLKSKNAILARLMIDVQPVELSLKFPSHTVAGATIPVEWIGPDFPADFISVARPGASGTDDLHRRTTNDGFPLGLKMPLSPGTYEVRYIQAQGNIILISRQVDVIGEAVTLTAPQSAMAGGQVEIGWTGLDNARDSIVISILGSPDTSFIHDSQTDHGSPISLQLLAEPGQYVIRYIADGSPDTLLAETEITLTAVEATISAPELGSAGDMLNIDWTGPNFKRDYIAIGPAGGGRRTTYAYTGEGSPLQLKLPDEPGDYEVW